MSKAAISLLLAIVAVAFLLPTADGQGETGTQPDPTSVPQTQQEQPIPSNDFGLSDDKSDTFSFPGTVLDIVSTGVTLPTSGSATRVGSDRAGGQAAQPAPAEQAARDDTSGDDPIDDATCVDDGDAIAPMTVAEADQQEADRAARDQELLDASDFGRDGSNRQAGQLKDTGHLRSHESDSTSKPAKSPMSRFFQGDEGDVDESSDATIAEQEANNPPPPTSAPLGIQDACVEYFCFNERIEDVRFGHLSDEPDGGFYEYISLIGGFIDFANGLGQPSAAPADLDTLAVTISDDQLGTRPTVTVMPVFYFCRRDAIDGPIETGAEGYFPSFAWDTSVEAEFDIPAILAGHHEQLSAQASGVPPQIETIPPIELGYTFVKLPMWLWLVDPFPGAEAHTLSQERTSRLASRATLINVAWTIDGHTFDCTREEMKEFLHGTSDLRTEESECSHTFNELTDYTITASATYLMQQQVSYRGHVDNQWPDAPWVPYPEPLRYFTITSTTPEMTVREVVAVNVPLDATSEEIDAITARLYGD